MTIACLVCDHANEPLLNQRMAINVEILVHRGRFSLIMVTSLETTAGRVSCSPPAAAVVQDANRSGSLPGRGSLRYTKDWSPKPRFPWPGV